LHETGLTIVGVHGPELTWEQPYEADVELARHP
jgi:hypothetical protein